MWFIYFCAVGKALATFNFPMAWQHNDSSVY
jgi:hypothetical protein